MKHLLGIFMVLSLEALEPSCFCTYLHDKVKGHETLYVKLTASSTLAALGTVYAKKMWAASRHLGHPSHKLWGLPLSGALLAGGYFVHSVHQALTPTYASTNYGASFSKE